MSSIGWEKVIQLGAAVSSSILAAILWPVVFPTTQELGSQGDGRGTPWGIPYGTVAFAGSFNPPHLGHLAMFKWISKQHSKVYAVVGFNSTKKYDVSYEQRVALLRKMLAGLPNVEVVAVEGYIWRFAMKRGCSKLYRGIRSWEQDGAAERFLDVLNRLAPPY